ncbi:hypothetical protein PR202_gb04803 [Eleusine coracana subsp. coracana]|uniref:Transferrin receptor-like dimerisation domain-containing protein n=1 Tax=Eleusine coracana subsp. coracana TaxID=191504 RepID=A0AAV5E697_ELECO|nr:hypothetical protein PR202_gb04803 [Eleusine coracana subsp. coracana]
MASDDMPGIPALPVSGRDGEAILQLIGGEVAPDDWQGGDGAPVYRLGPGPAVLNLTYTGNETMATIQNVISVIEGEEEPERQGSTEWVEENRAMLASRTIAYLNVDSAVAGPGFYASATPQLDELLKDASKQIGRLGGGGSDYSAFVQHIGVPSVDMSMGPGYAVYHSLYDDFTWIGKVWRSLVPEACGRTSINPPAKRHNSFFAVASIWGLLALKLSDEEILPFNYTCYARELENGAMDINRRVLGMPVNLSPLYKSIKEFKRAVLKVDSELKALETWRSWARWRNNPLKIKDINDRLMMTERAFTEREGLSGRPWYKHLIYGPSLYNDYGAEVYPGVDDAIQRAKRTNISESWKSVQHEIHRISRVINQAALVLSGRLT